MPKVFIIYYSLYHHIATLAEEVKKGLESEGVDVEVYQVKIGIRDPHVHPCINEGEQTHS